MKCPSCGVEFEESEAEPFCSRRCRLIDLGNWLDEKYRIGGEPPPENEDPERNSKR